MIKITPREAMGEDVRGETFLFSSRLSHSYIVAHRKEEALAVSIIIMESLTQNRQNFSM